MSVDVYINFNGNCREAVEFYAEVFGTEKPQIMTFGEAPPPPEFALPEEAKNLVMHTRLNISGTVGMELQETFWSKCYGQVTDKFGIIWQLSLDH